MEQKRPLNKGMTVKSSVEAEVVADVDVIVAGAGTAGCAAAIAAARNGARVLLVEQTGSLGGMMTVGNAGLTKYISHAAGSVEHNKVLEKLKTGPAEVQVAGGIPMEITNRLLESGSALGTDGTAGSYVFTDPMEFKGLLFSMMEENNVELLLHSMIVDVLKHENEIRGLVVENKSGRQILLSKVIIDTTGDGDVAAKAGAPFYLGIGKDDWSARLGSEVGAMNPMGAMYRVAGVDLERCFAFLKEHPEHFCVQVCSFQELDQAYEAFKKNEMMCIVVRVNGGAHQIYNTPTPGLVIHCCGVPAGDGTSVKDLTKGEMDLLRVMRERTEQLRGSIPGFEDCYLLDAPEVSVRETRHFIGEYNLSAEDILATKQFEDTIGLGSHPVDIKPRPQELIGYSYPTGWFFQIPYRCLVPKKVENLLIAGRCICNTHEASGCTRVTVTCMITGEAAGTAAAMCAADGVTPRQLNTDTLRKRLSEQGVKLDA